jgi:hypothetical protein
MNVEELKQIERARFQLSIHPQSIKCVANPIDVDPGLPKNASLLPARGKQ